jgi:ligand-binding sensor domain-containing protein
MATLNLNNEKIDKLYIGGQLICGGNDGYATGDIVPVNDIKEVYKLSELKTEKWSFQADSRSIKCITADKDGNVYVGGDKESKIIKLNKDGQKIWETNGVREFSLHSIEVDNEGNVFCEISLTLKKISKDGIEVKDLAQFNSGVDKIIIDDEGYIYVTSFNRLIKFDKDGKSIWTYQITGTIRDAYLSDDGNIYIAIPGEIKVINTAYGQLVKSYFGSMDVEIWSVATDADYVYFCDNDNSISKVNKNDNISWRKTYTSRLYKIRVDERGHVFVGTHDALIEYSPDGEELRKYLPGSRITDLKLDNDGNIYTKKQHKFACKLSSTRDLVGYEILKDKGE